jgi:hypothetical protein
MRVQPLHFQGSIERTWAPLLAGLGLAETSQSAAAAMPIATQAIHA